MHALTRILSATTALVALAAGLSACGSDETESGSAAAEGGDLSGRQVTFLTLTPKCEPCARTSQAIVDTLEAEGVEVTTESVDFGAAAEQVQKFNQALSTNPDGIVIWPTDTTSIIPALKLAQQNYDEIPIIITTYKPDTDDDSLYDAFVGGDDFELGRMQAQALVQGLEAAGKPTTGAVIEIEGAPGAATTIGRNTGFADGLAEFGPDLELVGSQPGNWDQTESTTAASALISKHDDVIGIYAHSDIMLAGAILAAERAGLTPGKDFVGVAIDCSVEGYRNIESGKQYGTGMWDPNVIGADTGNAAIAVMKGESVEKESYFETPEITKENLTDCKQAAGLE